MNKKIFRSNCLVTVLTLVACFVLIMGVLYSYFSGRLAEELRSEAGYISAGVERGGMDYLTALSDTSKRITLIAGDGTVLYDNTVDPAQMENHLDREEVQEALATGAGESDRMSATLTEKTVYYALRLTDGGVLRVANTHYTALSLLMGIAQPVIAVIFLALILAGVLSWRVSKLITEPINAIDLEHPLNSETYEELRPLLTRISVQNHTIARQLDAARQKEEEFRVITENMSECILMLDGDGRLLTANSAAVHLLDAGEGGRVCRLDEESKFRAVVEDVLKGVRGEAVFSIEERHYQLIGNPVRQGSAVIGGVLLLLDETEKLDREQLRREFTANVSHELKTPLTSISGFAELMMSGLVRGEDVADCSQSIYKEAQRLIALVGDILRLSDLDEGGKLHEDEPVELVELAKDAAERLTPEAEKNQVTLSVQGVPGVVIGAEQILFEMVYNLIDNAIKYNRPGGTVEVRLTQQEDTVTLLVRDTGIGIPAEQHSRVFERFYRVDKSHSKSVGGTGLGLSIVRHGAEYHNAQLSLESRLGEGTRVTITFPKPDGAGR